MREGEEEEEEEEEEEDGFLIEGKARSHPTVVTPGGQNTVLTSHPQRLPSCTYYQIPASTHSNKILISFPFFFSILFSFYFSFSMHTQICREMPIKVLAYRIRAL